MEMRASMLQGTNAHAVVCTNANASEYSIMISLVVVTDRSLCRFPLYQFMRYESQLWYSSGEKWRCVHASI